MFRNNMKILVNKEEVFRSSGNKVAIGATTSGYTLQYSVDGNDFDDHKEFHLNHRTVLFYFLNQCFHS